MIDWTKTTADDLHTIRAIAKRAVSLTGNTDSLTGNTDIMAVEMDISACHIQCPLDLQALLDADNSNFVHDVTGISAHINRTDGKLRDCFVPRYAKHDKVS
jgi:hypothetical protein